MARCSMRQIGLGFADAAGAGIEIEATRISLIRTDRPFRAPRQHQSLPEELERHRAFVATIKDALWTEEERRAHSHND